MRVTSNQVVAVGNPHVFTNRGRQVLEMTESRVIVPFFFRWGTQVLVRTHLLVDPPGN